MTRVGSAPPFSIFSTVRTRLAASLLFKPQAQAPKAQAPLIPPEGGRWTTPQILSTCPARRISPYPLKRGKMDYATNSFSHAQPHPPPKDTSPPAPSERGGEIPPFKGVRGIFLLLYSPRRCHWAELRCGFQPIFSVGKQTG